MIQRGETLESMPIEANKCALQRDSQLFCCRLPQVQRKIYFAQTGTCQTQTKPKRDHTGIVKIPLSNGLSSS